MATQVGFEFGQTSSSSWAKFKFAAVCGFQVFFFFFCGTVEKALHAWDSTDSTPAPGGGGGSGGDMGDGAAAQRADAAGPMEGTEESPQAVAVESSPSAPASAVLAPAASSVQPASDDSPTATRPAPTLLDAVWESITTPGAGPGLVATLNASLFALLLCLAYFWWRGLGDVHMAVLAALCLGLLVTFNAFFGQATAAAAAAAADTKQKGD